MRAHLAAVLLASTLFACGGTPASIYSKAEPSPGPTPAAPAGDDQAAGAADGGAAPTPAPDAAQADAGAAPDAAEPTPDAAQVDPCEARLASARAAGLQCGSYQGCDLGECGGYDLCGGGGNAPGSTPNVCGHRCLDTGAETLCDSAPGVTFQAAWSVEPGCTYVYRIVSGARVLRVGGTADCVNTSQGGQQLVCCPQQ